MVRSCWPSQSKVRLDRRLRNQIGSTGYAYVVDAQGRLVSHPDISRVLQMTDLSRLPQVQSASTSGAYPNGFAGDGRDSAGVPVLSAYAKIAPLNWTVFVEQPRAEAFAPLVASIARSALILIAALALAVTADIVAARRMVAPIGELRRGAQRFGAGDLAHRIEVASGDELESSPHSSTRWANSCARPTQALSGGWPNVRAT